MLKPSNHFNLATVLEDSARFYPEKTAIIYGDHAFSYQQINAISNKIANGLRANGIQKGDKVAISCPNIPYFPMIYYGILKVGATVVPLNVLLKRDEIAYHLDDSNAKAYFCFTGTPDLPMGVEGWEGFNKVETCKNFWMIMLDFSMPSSVSGTETLGDLIGDQPADFSTEETSISDTAVILYTSGTTGRPKGAELSHGNIFLNALDVSLLFNLTSNDIQLITLPLFHAFGQVVQMNTGFLSANTLVLIPRFDPAAVLGAMEKHDVTIFCGVPTMYWALLNYPEAEKFDLEKIARTLRLGVSGGAALPVEVMKQFEEKFTIPILEGYGLSETSPVATFSRLDKKRKPGSIGVPIKGVEVIVADEEGNEVLPGTVGEILIRGHNIMKGYYNKPEATEEAFKGGWFHSGDLGKMDEDGYFYIVDRLKDMIIRGGFNVYPREVEEVLMTHPSITLAAVVGVPDEKLGEEIVAHVLLKEGANDTEEDIIEWAKSKMAAYKYPRRVIIRNELPMNATGKILKRLLREQETQ